MKKMFFKVMVLSFALALVLNIALTQSTDPEFPPLFGANTVTQPHIS
jgi:hypothetical protein